MLQWSHLIVKKSCKNGFSLFLIAFHSAENQIAKILTHTNNLLCHLQEYFHVLRIANKSIEVNRVAVFSLLDELTKAPWFNFCFLSEFLESYDFEAILLNTLADLIE